MSLGRRRMLAAALSFTAAAVCPAADRTMKRLAVVGSQWPQDEKDDYTRAFEPLGYRLGVNLEIAWFQFPDRSNWAKVVPPLAAQAVQMRPDCILTGGPIYTRYVREATRTIPIVSNVGDGDPVALGFAKTLVRPGGNITGLHGGFTDVNTKRIEFLRKLVPATSSVGWIALRPQLEWLGIFEGVARDMGLPVRAIVVDTSDAPQFANAKRQIAGLRNEGCLAAHFQSSVPVLVDAVSASALDQRLAISYSGMDGNVSREGIMFMYRSTHSAKGYETPRRTVAMIARIFGGERPENIPFEGPAGYDLLLNLKTARRIGVTVPPDIITLANEVIR